MQKNQTSNEQFFLIGWSKRISGKLQQDAVIVRGNSGIILRDRIIEMHSQANFTHFDYKIYDLSRIVREQGLLLSK